MPPGDKVKCRSFSCMQCLGPSFDGYVYLLAEERRGGILLAWNKSIVEVAH
jgi:hypothetical protein